MMSDTYNELEKKLLDGEITPDEFVKEYNERMKKESESHAEPFKPHEHI